LTASANQSVTSLLRGSAASQIDHRMHAVNAFIVNLYRRNMANVATATAEKIPDRHSPQHVAKHAVKRRIQAGQCKSSHLEKQVRGSAF
jgi:hypothetical protein